MMIETERLVLRPFVESDAEDMLILHPNLLTGNQGIRYGLDAI